MFRLKLTYLTIVLGTLIFVAVLPMTIYAQDVPQRTEAPKEPKRKRVKKKKFKGDKSRSNRKQLRQTRYKTKSKQGDRAVSGDITGKKYKSRKTPRQTYARPQPDPYASRRVRGRGEDRAGPEPPPTFRTPPRGEKARRGDITGKRRIRTQSASSARVRSYPRKDPYAGREQKSVERAQRIRKSQMYSRSASRSGESRRTFSVARPKTSSGTAKIRRSKNAYAGREQRRGEKATDKDIAGRKLRTRNVDSTPKIPRGGYAPTDTYYGRKRGKEGGRFSRGVMQTGAAPSISRSGEQGGKRYREPGMKNYQSPRPRTTGPSFDPYAGRKRGGEGERFRDNGKLKVRTASRRGERKMRIQAVVPNSVSGRAKIKRSKNPYAGREQRTGERASNKDIAGRKQRTRGFESPRPQWGQSIRRPDTYYGRKDRGDRAGSTKGIAKGAGSISGRVWNNRGIPIGAKPPSGTTQQATRYQGRFRPFELKPGYGNDRAIGNYKGRFRPYELNPGYSDNKAISNYKGRFRPFELNPGYSDDRRVSKWQGNIRSKRPIKGGGSISGRRWNNKGVPIGAKPPSESTQMATQFRGRFRPFDLQPGYSDDRAIAKYKGRFRPFELNPGYSDDRRMARWQGNIPGKKPLKGGGSISGRIWNNKETPIGAKPPSQSTQMATQFRGRFRLFELKPGYSDDKAIANFKGRFRPFELNPGYSDDKAIANYKGRFRPFELNPGYSDDRRIAKYQGNIKSRRPLKGGGSISGTMWNNDGNPLAKKYGPLEGSGFQGNMKTRRTVKGAGGSISGTLWNNDGNPLAKKYGPMEGSGYQGNMKTRGAVKGAGGSISGTLWNNDGNPLAKKYGPMEGSGFQGNVKGSQYKTPGQPEGTEYGRAKSVIFITPRKAKNYRPFVNVTGQAKPSQAEGTEYGKTRKFFFMSPKSGSLESRSLSKNNKSEDFNYGRVQSVFFITPSKAKNYKGYVSKDPKILELFSSRKQMHPSYSYTQGESKNAKEEKEKIFKFKVWWAKIFGANGNQPENLKSREKKPRYDKRETELWYE
jgi:hypothetical protein